MLLLAASSRVNADVPAPDKAALQTKQDALFQQMLSDPSNLELPSPMPTFRPSLVTIRARLQRSSGMPLFNPNLPRVDLELGVLYFRMGSFKAAQSYFDKAKSFNPPAEVMARVDDYLAKSTRGKTPASSAAISLPAPNTNQMQMSLPARH